MPCVGWIHQSTFWISQARHREQGRPLPFEWSRGPTRSAPRRVHFKVEPFLRCAMDLQGSGQRACLVCSILISPETLLLQMWHLRLHCHPVLKAIASKTHTHTHTHGWCYVVCHDHTRPNSSSRLSQVDPVSFHTHQGKLERGGPQRSVDLNLCILTASLVNL